MRLAALTAQQKKDIRDGKTVTVTLKDGGQIVVTPHMIQWAKEVLASGGKVTILPEVIGTGKMDEVEIG